MTLDQYRPTPPAAQHTRRTLLRRIGASTAVLGVLAVAGCTPTSSDTAATNSTSSALPGPTPNLPAGDMSRGAANFYTSDQVSVQPVTFKNQYGMNVAGNLFVPNDIDRNTTNPAIVVGHPMGAVKEQSANMYATKMAERGFVTMSLDLSFWGAQRRPTPQRGVPRHLRRRLQRRGGLPAHPVVRRPRTHRRPGNLRQRKLRHQRGQDRPAHQIGGHGQHVRHGRSQPRRAAQRRHPRAAHAKSCNRQPNSATSNSAAARPPTPAAPRTNSPTNPPRSTGSSTTSTAPPAATAPTPPRSRR